MSSNEVRRAKDANRALWDEWTAIHVKSDFYDLDSFKAGEIHLDPLEQEELGDVSGKSLLHLQCHFGLSTLSWARLGAKVTGVDFSPKSIAMARSLAEELKIDARFVLADIDHLPDSLTGEFDIVFTSYGVLAWLPDLNRWAEVIAHFLKPGGVFYIAEIHPFTYVFDDQENCDQYRVRYPYFPDGNPKAWPVEGSYADRTAQVSQTESYEWMHTISDVINALIGAGLRIEYFHEFPYTVFKQYPFVEKDADGLWRPTHQRDYLPLLFSIKATQPGDSRL
jgi:SAM-dependent methyltransferase